MSVKSVTILGIFSLLSACGGGSGGVSLPVLLERTDGFIGENGSFEDITRSTTRAEGLAVGSASYRGVALVAQQNAIFPTEFDFIAIGDARATVTFGNGVVEGSATNFYEMERSQDISDLGDADGTAIDGSLTVRLSDDGGFQPIFTGTWSGSFTNVDGESLRFGGPAAGGFGEDDARYLGIEGGSDSGREGFTILAERN